MFELKKILILTVAVVALLAANVFGAAGYRCTLLFPNSNRVDDGTGAITYDDSTWANFANKQNCIDLFEMAKNAKTIVSKVVVAANDADIDSIAVITRSSVDGSNFTVVDSGEITGSTLGSADTFTVAIAASEVGRYLQTTARVFGDAAGTATQTIILKTFLLFYDGLGQPYMIRESTVNTSFAE